jgi:hypothetical protein
MLRDNFFIFFSNELHKNHHFHRIVQMNERGKFKNFSTESMLVFSGKFNRLARKIFQK